MTFDKDFKKEAVSLSNEIGVRKAAEQLGVPYNTLADWRSKRKRHGAQAYVGSGRKRMPTDPKEQRSLSSLKSISAQKPHDVMVNHWKRRSMPRALFNDIFTYRTGLAPLLYIKCAKEREHFVGTDDDFLNGLTSS